MTSTLTRTPSTSPVVRRAERRLHLGKRPAAERCWWRHVLSSVAWFGIAVFVLFLLLVARSTGDVEYARALYRTVETSIWLSVPMAAVSGLTGLVLGLGTPWGVATHWWVVLKEIAFVPLVVTDFLVIAPAAHDLARGGSAGFLEPAIGHCVLLAFGDRGLDRQAVREDAPRASPPTVAGMSTPSRRDLAIAGGIAVVEVVGAAFAGSHQDTRLDFGVGGALLLVAGAVALAWRVRHPVAVLFVAYATTLTYIVLGYPQGPVYFSLIVAFCTTLLAGHRAVAWATIAIGWVTFLWLPPLLGTGDAPSWAAALGSRRVVARAGHHDGDRAHPARARGRAPAARAKRKSGCARATSSFGSRASCTTWSRTTCR